MTPAYLAATWAGLMGASGVALGAFGAHALKDVLVGPKTALWQTATSYHLLHAAVPVGLAAWLSAAGGPGRPGLAIVSIVGFVLGTLLFSGSLYALALGAPRWLGALTPMGGLLLIAGWLALAATAARGPRA